MPTKTRDLLRLNVQPGYLALSVNDQEVYSFDRDGRLLSAWTHDRTCIRTLDGRVVEKRWDAAAERKAIRCLDGVEARQFFEELRSRLFALRSEPVLTVSMGPEPVDSGQHHRDSVGQWFETLLSWDVTRLEREQERFARVYSPVGILPPDQYGAIVLQATIGCRWNRCDFCDFYREIPFRVRPESEFRSHVEAVKQFLGQRILLRRSIFLGDANALTIPQELLLKRLEILHHEFRLNDRAGEAQREPPPLTGVYSFVDAFTGWKKPVKDFQELRARHLRRVYLGAETGCDALLRWLNKPSTSEQACELVHTLKQAGLSVGVIVLTGPGGREYSREHVRCTAELLNAMALTSGDILYFSPLVTPPGSRYSQRAAASGLQALSPHEQNEQEQAIRAALRFGSNGKPKLARYDLREFVYC